MDTTTKYSKIINNLDNEGVRNVEDFNLDNESVRNVEDFNIDNEGVRNVEGWSDQMIDDALDGEPDAYWNID